ncbi:hypothetical protein [Flavobacterium sp. LC2016-12]|uniref:hypothetical protein n=1 Tax=Flavobacterium sp. LC2016-12 TaxID=2783794 RepID=UPI00188D42A9|nr:hypothetical protein [Flavobacterium sp. LC2016-12]MBF4466897.1 hypothetical protein [Flavobacterium sp. LC2016-12]
MRKITCLLLLIQSGFMMAQTKTVVTQNGEKVAINTGANNGLTTNNGYIQLGGALTQPSVLTTTPAFTLAIQGLQAGAPADNVLVSDGNGVLKYIPQSSFGGADNLGNHSATQDLLMNKNNIVFADRYYLNSNTITFSKTNGIFSIKSSTNSTSALTIEDATNKTTLASAQISKGTDGVNPVVGSIATAADTSGNIIWHVPSEAAPVGTAFFKYTVSTDLSLSSANGRIKFGTEVVDKSNAVSRKLVNNTGTYSVFIAPKTGYYSIMVSVYQFFGSTGSVAAKLFSSSIQLVDDTSGQTIATNEIYQYTTTPYYWMPQTITTVSKFTAGQRITVFYNNNFKSVSGINASTNIAGDTSGHPAISYITGYFISE